LLAGSFSVQVVAHVSKEVVRAQIMQARKAAIAEAREQVIMYKAKDDCGSLQSSRRWW